jgi:hypothetical protein
MSIIMSLLRMHTHYWGVPHERPSDKRIIMTCYECGAERVVKVNLRPPPARSDPDSQVRQTRASLYMK